MMRRRTKCKLSSVRVGLGTRARNESYQPWGVRGIALGVIAQAALDWRRKETRKDVAFYFISTTYEKHCEMVGINPRLLPKGITWHDVREVVCQHQHK